MSTHSMWKILPVFARQRPAVRRRKHMLCMCAGPACESCVAACRAGDRSDRKYSVKIGQRTARCLCGRLPDRERFGERRDRNKSEKDTKMTRLKKDFRRFAAALLCIILALSAVGCGSGSKDSGESAGGSSDALSMPEITSKDGVATSKQISLGDDFSTDGMQLLALEDGVFYAFNYSYEGDGYEQYELVRFNEDGSGFERVKYEPEGDENAEVTSSAFKDGCYYLGITNTANSPALDYALENDLGVDDEIPDGLSEEALSTYQLCCVTADGKQKWIKDVREPADPLNYYIDSIAMTDEGIMVVSTEGVDLYSAEDGSFITTKCAVTPDELVGILYVMKDGTVIMADDATSANTQILRYDEGKKKFVKSFSLPSALVGANIFTGMNYDLYFTSENGIYGAKLGADKLTAVINYVNSDLDVEGVTKIVEIGDGKLVVQAYGSAVTLDTYVLEPVSPKDVKDKKEISLAGYYISYDVRSEVIQFNKENSDFRITIQDYSQYDLATDEYDTPTGLSKMNTDIVSGNIPDILVLSESMPVNSYISKGMMLDLTDRYESDKEIDKSDFLQNVVDAFKTDGKMYTIVPGFTVTGIAGKAKYIGDGKDLTINKAKEIAAKIGLPETGVFGIIDRESVLSCAIEFSGDQFIDMDKHTCNFNNAQFQELLEFANKFPAQISDDLSYDYSTQFLADKALLGIQYINSPYDYYYMTRQLYGDVNMTITGFPSEKNKGPAVAPSMELGISSNASDPDGCWSFIRRFLLPDYQGKQESNLPLSRKAIRAAGETIIKDLKEQQKMYEDYMKEQELEVSEQDSMDSADEAVTGDNATEATEGMDTSTSESEDLTGKPYPEEDFDGTHEEYEQYLKDFEAESTKGEEEISMTSAEAEEEETSVDTPDSNILPDFGESDIDSLEKILENLSFSVNSERDVLNIILEEAGAYFAGQKTTAEVADIVQSRIQVYLKENE